MKDADDRGGYQTIKKRMRTWERYGRVLKSGQPHFGTDELGSVLDVGVLPLGQWLARVALPLASQGVARV